jgi:hypothetical protein
VITGSRCNLDKPVAVFSARICIVYHNRLSSGNGCSHHFLAPILIPKLVTVGVCIPANDDVANICVLFEVGLTRKNMISALMRHWFSAKGT